MKTVLLVTGFIAAVTAAFAAVLLFSFPVKYKTEIDDAAALYNVDGALIASIIRAESSFRANAVSAKGAVGLMQVMPSTANYAAATAGIAPDLTDPRTNVLIGTYYIRYLLDKFGDLKTALIAYNAGEGNVANWLTDETYSVQSGDKNVLTSCPYRETNAYVEKVLNGMNMYKHKF